ncbi:hypothetical protein H7K34_09570 [Mycobacterium montefiorense]|nr:hypothetical protein [Mycobacterium montefiorense]
MQSMWVVDHDIDIEGLTRFHRNLGLGVLGRRIERSPLKFARNRWVLAEEPVDIEFAEGARPRSELGDWADERAAVPIDPERGPGWHLGVLPLTDGSTAVTLVCSHYLIDGLGLMGAVVDAVLGNVHDLGLPPPDSRTRRHALTQDACRTVRDVPEVARAVIAGTKQSLRLRGAARPSVSPPVIASGSDDEDLVVVPTVTIQVRVDDWDACADTLGGTSKTLVAGWAVKLAEHMGRRRASDGAVTLSIPIRDRPMGNALSFVPTFPTSAVVTSVDPTLVTTDLRGARAAIKQGLRDLQQQGDGDPSQLLWLAGFRRKRTWKRIIEAMDADPDATVICSHFGEVPPVVHRLDGTDSACILARAVNQHEKRRWLDQAGGQMVVQSWRTQDSFDICVSAYQPGAENTRRALTESAEKALAAFGLTGKIE